MTPEQAHAVLMSSGLWEALHHYRAMVDQQGKAKTLHALSQEQHVIALHYRQDAADRVAQALLAALDAAEIGTT